jgi:F-type H+-transporting ATPase subunit b
VELDWTSFLLEIINFLVLVWILKHFLYRPVLDMVDQRRRAVDKVRADAEQIQTEAVDLRKRYEERLQSWEQEKTAARAKLRTDLDQERQRLALAQQQSLQAEREKFEVLLQREARDNRRQVEREALDLGGRISRRLLARLSSPELEQRLIRLLVEDLGRLTKERIAEMRAACKLDRSTVQVTSAFPLDQPAADALREGLIAALDLSQDCRWRFQQDQSLIAGVRVALGSWILRANLQDELQYFFTEGANAD